MKITNSFKPHDDYLIDREASRGFSSEITGKNFCDEPIHGARDYGGTMFGFIVKADYMGFANDTRFFVWPDFKDRWVRTSISGTANGNVTSYWSLGTSILTSFSDGVPEYMLVYDDINCKYFKRVWEYGVDIPQNEFERKTAIKRLSDGELVIKEYEITEEEYTELVPDDYDFLPTFYFQIRRFSDSQSSDYDATQLINNIDFTLLFNAGRLYENENSIWVKIGDGKRVYARQRYFPALSNSDPKRPVSRLNQLPILATKDFLGTTINIRVFKRLRNEDIDPSNFKEMRKMVGNDSYPFTAIGLRGKNPLDIWVDSNKTILSRYDPWKEMTGNKKITQDTVCIFEVVDDLKDSGKLEFPTIKSSKPTAEMVTWGAEQHLEIVQNHKELHYYSTKNEDARVVMLKNEIVNGGKHRGNLIESICYLTDDKLTRKDLIEDDNHELTENYLKRNWDWLISNDDGKQLHNEFMVKTEDWDHIDQFFYKIGKNICPYHTLVVGDFASSAGKRKDIREQLRERPPKHAKKLWMCSVDDFMKGNISKFKLLWEKKT